jgi:protein SCO1/2
MKSLIVLLVVFGVAIAITYPLLQPKEEKLPVINPTDVKEEMMDPEVLRLGYGHTIGTFSFTDQLGRTVTDKLVEDKIYVAEYFFTTCGTICPKMNKQMQRVHEAYLKADDFMIMSFTVNPETDSVEQMKRYADGHKVTHDQWRFLTGTREKLYELARKSFFVLKPAEAQNLGDAGSDFIHTNNFVLVDKQKRIRGYYDGTSTEEVDKMIRDIKRLQEE